MAKGTRFAYLIEFDDNSSLESVSTGCQGLGVKNGLFYIKSPAGAERILYGASAALTSGNIVKFASGGFGDSVIFENGGNVGFGTENPTGNVHIIRTSSGQTCIQERVESHSGGAAMVFYKARGTVASKEEPNLNDVCGGLFAQFWGPHSGAYAYRSGAAVRFLKDGAADTNGSNLGYTPTRITFETVDTSTALVRERMVIKNDGKIGVNTTTPTDEFDVVGTIKATSYKVGSDAGVDVNGGTLKAVTVKKGIITAATAVTPIADGTYDISAFKFIQISGGIITALIEDN